MSESSNVRVDPLVDAYHQASAFDGARPSDALRAAVLAHARVVAQSASGAGSKSALSDAVRATPAANEPKPVWRMVAGVVLGLVGMWMYQLTRPGTTGEANVAVLSAPPSAKSAVGESPATSAAAASATAPARQGAASPVPAAAQADTAVAVAAPATPTARALPARERGDLARARNANVADASAGGAPRDAVADAARNETSVALAKVAAPTVKANVAVAAAAPVPVAAPVEAAVAAAATAPTRPSAAATSALPDAATAEPIGEVALASADKRKSVSRSAETRAPAAAAAPSPNAFPATAASAASAVVASPAAAASPPPAAPTAATGTAMRQRADGAVGTVGSPDVAMFSAIRVGNINALRAALARGANVNARDEAGKSTLQIARERNDIEMVKALDAAGAK